MVLLRSHFDLDLISISISIVFTSVVFLKITKTFSEIYPPLLNLYFKIMDKDTIRDDLGGQASLNAADVLTTGKILEGWYFYFYCSLLILLFLLSTSHFYFYSTSTLFLFLFLLFFLRLV